MKKLTEFHKERIDDAKTGKSYGFGVALKTAKKSAKDKLTAAVRNPEGTPKYLQRCAYYPHHCNVLGHTTAASRLCGVNALTPVERKALLAKIAELAVEEELVLVGENGKYIVLYFLRT